MDHSHEPRPGRTVGLPLAPASTGGAIDPVCGMTVDPANAPASVTHGGRTFYFCNPSCARKFQADPGRYTEGPPSFERMEPAAPPPPGAKVEYTCPMHPEVVQDHPGSCPKCGMALEPRTVSAEEGPNPELADMTRRLAVGLALGVPLALLHLFGHALGWHNTRWAEALLATPIVFWCGLPFFVRAVASVRALSPNMFT